MDTLDFIRRTGVLTLCMLTAACGGGGGGGDHNGRDDTDTTAPTVVSVTPAADATGIAPGTDVSVVFSGAMKCSTLTEASFTLANAGVAIDGSVACNGNTATFTPTFGLPEDATVTATLTTAAADSANNTLAADYTWTFTTRARAWGTEAPLSPTAISAYHPRIALMPDGSGSALAVWSQGNGTVGDIWSATYTVAEGWTDPELVEDVPSNAYDPEIFMGPDGTAFSLWLEDNGDRLWINQYTPGEGWGTASQFNEEGVVGYPAHMAFAPDGSAIAIWGQRVPGFNNRMVARRYANGTWSETETIDNPPAENEGIRFHSVAIDKYGNAVVTWSWADRDLWANTYVPGAGWGTPARIDDQEGESLPARIKVDADGNFLVVWRERFEDRSELYTRRYTVAAQWEDDALLASGERNYPLPSIAFDRQGNAVAIWTTDVVSALHYAPGSGWGDPVTISADGATNLTQTTVEFDGYGNAIAIWWQDGQFVTNRYRPGVDWGTAQVVGTNASDWIPASLVVDAKGDAMALWYRVSTPTQLMFNRFE